MLPRLNRGLMIERLLAALAKSNGTSAVGGKQTFRLVAAGDRHNNRTMTGGFFPDVSPKAQLASLGMTLDAIVLQIVWIVATQRPELMDRSAVLGCYTALMRLL